MEQVGVLADRAETGAHREVAFEQWRRVAADPRARSRPFGLHAPGDLLEYWAFRVDWVTPGNTTLSLVVTNAALAPDALRQLGRQVHSSLARAIQPFHTAYDGDVLFAASTGAVRDSALDPIALGVLASELAWDAALRAVGAEPAGGPQG